MNILIVYRGNPIRGDVNPLHVTEKCMASVTKQIVTPLRNQQHSVHVAACITESLYEQPKLIDTIKKNAESIHSYKPKPGGDNQRDNMYQAMTCHNMYEKYNVIIVTRFDIEYKEPVNFDRWFNKDHDVTYISWEPGQKRICDVMFIVKSKSIDQFVDCVKNHGNPHMLHYLHHKFDQSGLKYGSILPAPTNLGTGCNKHPLFWIRRNPSYKRQ